jgi:hypothetical protein
VRRQTDREGFEQGVERGKARTLDVPVGDLDLAVQIEPVGQPLVERIGNGLTGGLGQMAGTLVHDLLLPLDARCRTDV